MRLREALKMFRKELGLTQMELADLLDVNFSTVNRWENGKSVPNRGTAIFLLQYAVDHGVSDECKKMLREVLLDARREELNFSDSGLNSVEQETVCQLVDDAASGVYVCDMDTDELLYVNKKAEKYAGKSFVQGFGIKCYEFFMHQKKPCSFCPKKHLKEKKYSKTHIVMPKSDRTYRFSGRRLTWNGKPAHAQYFHDETYALEAQNGLKQLLDGINIGVSIGYAYDDGRLELSYLNDGYYAMMHSTREKRQEYIGFMVLKAVHPDDRERVNNEIRTAAKERRDFSIPYRAKLEESNYKWLNITGTYIDQDEDRCMYYCAFTDVNHLMEK